MKVSIIGTGYVGLVSGVCLAEKGHQVICVDVDQAKIDKLNKGIPVIYEDGLQELLQKNLHHHLVATTDLRQAVLSTELSLIAVGTPFNENDIDLCYIKTVAAQIGTVLEAKAAYHVVVVKSTVVPGTTDEVVRPILEQTSGKKAGRDFGVGMNPEFLREGEAVSDFMYPDRIVLGGIDEKSIAALDHLYNVFPGVDKIRTNTRTAEMIKYAANSLLATLISFSNEIANLCGTVGVDVAEAMHGVHLDKRFTPILDNGTRIFPSFISYLVAGCGFGGSCFPKDVQALIAYGTKAGRPMKLLESVIEVNAHQPQKVIDLLRRHYSNLTGVQIAVLGMAFKPGTDDIRESPALSVTKTLLAEKAVVRAYDPIARHQAEQVFGNAVAFCDDLQEAIAGVSAILIMTRWQHFELLPELLATMDKPPLVVDGRRMLDKHSVPWYEGIGL
ncbi:MAG TPA: UDP-glucose/GDP-mannose dehydrogenase family protein [Nitrososphaera sp.]|jgi:UDPglucose 6-dehydrogenase/GDP-mannose 6-dehydrogenase